MMFNNPNTLTAEDLQQKPVKVNQDGALVYGMKPADIATLMESDRNLRKLIDSGKAPQIGDGPALGRSDGNSAGGDWKQAQASNPYGN